MMLFETYEADGTTPTYFKTAKEHEVVFRGVLAHLQSGAASPHAALRMPKDTSVDAPIDELLATCHPRTGDDRFAVGEFLVGPREGSGLQELVGGVAANQAVIYFGRRSAIDMAAEAVCRYQIDADGLPVYQDTYFQAIS